MRSGIFALLTGILMVALPGMSQAQTLSGDLIRAAGGSTFSANAADAIQSTCLDLVAAGDNVTTEQADLRFNCGNMVRTTIALLGSGTANEYGFQTEEQLYNGLRQFSGEEISSQTRYATDNNNRQISGIGNRLGAIRAGLRPASGLALNLQGMELLTATGDASVAGTPIVGGNAGTVEAPGRWGWFANVEYGFGDRDDSINENQFDYDGWKVFAGVDYATENGWVFGGALSYNSNTVDFDNQASSVPGVAGGEIESDGYDIAGFFQYQTESTLYVNGILSWGRLDYDIERNVFFETDSSAPQPGPDRVMRSDTDGDQIEAEFNVGALFGEGPVTLDLFAGINALRVSIDSFVEQDSAAGGGLAMAYGNQEVDSVQSIVGATVRGSFNTDAAVFSPYLRAQWRHEFEDESREVDAQYALAIDPSATDIQFRLPTDDVDEDYGKIAAGLAAQLQNSVFLFIQWESTVGLKNTEAHLLTAGIRSVF